MKEIKETEISLIKQKVEINKAFQAQIDSTKKDCNSCDVGVAKLLADRKNLERIKQIEAASGSHLPKSQQPISKGELMDAMRQIVQKKELKKAQANEFETETNNIIKEKTLELKLHRQNDNVETLNYELEKNKARKAQRDLEDKNTKEMLKTEQALRAIENLEAKKNIEYSKMQKTQEHLQQKKIIHNQLNIDKILKAERKAYEKEVVMEYKENHKESGDNNDSIVQRQLTLDKQAALNDKIENEKKVIEMIKTQQAKSKEQNTIVKSTIKDMAREQN